MTQQRTIYILSLILLYCSCYPNSNYFGVTSFDKIEVPSPQSLIDSYLKKGAAYLYKPESFKKDMDSARVNFDSAFRLSKEIKDETFIHKCIFYYGELLFEENKYPEALVNLKKTAAYYHKNKKFEEEAEVWKKMGSRLFWKSPRSYTSIEEAVVSFEKAAMLYKILGLKEKYTDALKSIADAHLNQGRLQLAEKELLNVLSIYKKMKYKNLHFTYDLLADTKRLKGDLGKNLYYSLLCVKSMEQTGDLRFAPAFYEQLASAHRDLGHHEISISFLKKAISIIKSEKAIDYGSLYETTDLLSRELIAIKKPKQALHLVERTISEFPPKKSDDKAQALRSLAFCNDKNNQTAEAEYNYLKMIELYENEVPSLFLIDLSEAYFQTGIFYQKHQKLDKAKSYFHKSLNFPKGIVELNQIKEVNLSLFKIDSAQGNYLSSIHHFQLYKDLNDSIFNEKKNKQIEELQVLYGLEKKEKELSGLKLDMVQEKGKTNQAINMIKWGSGLVILLLIGLFLFWKSYQSKQKNNKLLESQKNEIDLKNNALHKLVGEKESLMKEIHHRVKNNLQIVMSLLRSQSSTLTNEEAFEAIQKSQQRLYAISLLHQKLYMTDIVREIEMKSYIDGLLENFNDTFDLSDRIDFKMDIESVYLHETQAISVGLILNETVTNAIKYAFPNQNKGTITIKLKPYLLKMILEISDNGIGLPSDFDLKTVSTLGTTLIKGLAEQLNGQAMFENQNGLTVRIEFAKANITDKSIN